MTHPTLQEITKKFNEFIATYQTKRIVLTCPVSAHRVLFRDAVTTKKGHVVDRKLVENHRKATLGKEILYDLEGAIPNIKKNQDVQKLFQTVYDLMRDILTFVKDSQRLESDLGQADVLSLQLAEWMDRHRNDRGEMDAAKILKFYDDNKEAKRIIQERRSGHDSQSAPHQRPYTNSSVNSSSSLLNSNSQKSEKESEIGLILLYSRCLSQSATDSFRFALEYLLQNVLQPQDFFHANTFFLPDDRIYSSLTPLARADTRTAIDQLKWRGGPMSDSNDLFYTLMHLDTMCANDTKIPSLKKVSILLFVSQRDSGRLPTAPVTQSLLDFLKKYPNITIHVAHYGSPSNMDPSLPAIESTLKGHNFKLYQASSLMQLKKDCLSNLFSQNSSQQQTMPSVQQKQEQQPSQPPQYEESTAPPSYASAVGDQYRSERVSLPGENYARYFMEIARTDLENRRKVQLSVDPNHKNVLFIHGNDARLVDACAKEIDSTVYQLYVEAREEPVRLGSDMDKFCKKHGVWVQSQSPNYPSNGKDLLLIPESNYPLFHRRFLETRAESEVKKSERTSNSSASNVHSFSPPRSSSSSANGKKRITVFDTNMISNGQVWKQIENAVANGHILNPYSHLGVSYVTLKEIDRVKGRIKAAQNFVRLVDRTRNDRDLKNYFHQERYNQERAEKIGGADLQIIAYCERLKKQYDEVILVTNDINLRNLSYSHDITTKSELNFD